MKDGIVKIVNILSTNINIKMIKKVLRQKKISIRLPYANKKLRKISYPMVDKTYNPPQDMIDKLQNLKGK